MSHFPVSGRIPFVVGKTSVVRIPVAGTRTLCLELSPRGHVPARGSASTLFVRHAATQLQSRLDFAYNKRTRTIDYHWNQNGTLENFVNGGQREDVTPWFVPHSALKCYRYIGRTLLVGGAIAEAVSIVEASAPLRNASSSVSDWCARWLGHEYAIADRALTGSQLGQGLALAVGEALDCIIAAFSGIVTPAELAAQVYDWTENTLFTPLDEVRPAL